MHCNGEGKRHRLIRFKGEGQFPDLVNDLNVRHGIAAPFTMLAALALATPAASASAPIPRAQPPHIVQDSTSATPALIPVPRAKPAKLNPPVSPRHAWPKDAG